ncbi:MAG TPA: sodium:proton exchanger [Candidatus Atribacteria bacterium]|nr:MAG: Ca2+/Na+ antiporter [Atribacteria bacterium 34_128]HAJ32784.1 sodium:proton exchanger [Candidatus Atribacteria bacterium]
MLNLWLLFLICALIIIFTGTKLTHYGDIIAKKTGLGRVWIGAALIPLATSLPEITSSSGAAWINAPNLAIGNIFGSIMFNLLIIAIADFAHGSVPLLREVSAGQILTAILGIFLCAIAALSMLLKPSFLLAGIGIDSLILIILYFLGILVIFKYSKRNKPDDVLGIPEENYTAYSLPLTNIKFLIAAIIIIFAAMKLAQVANSLANLTGWGTTFMGTIMLAIVTSLPELVTALAAIRIKAYDLAVGIVLGANILNMTIPFFSDIFYDGPPILSVVSPQHIISALIAIILTSIAISSVVYKPKRTVFNLGIAGWLIFIVYFLGIFLIFKIGIKI